MLQKRKKYLMSPYLFMMTCIYFCIAIGALIFVLYDDYVRYEGDYSRSLLLVGMTIIPLLVVYACNRFEYFGTVEIIVGGFIFRAPFCKKRIFLYEDMVEFGIDYGWLSVNRQFWIYFAKKPIDPKYRNRINRLKFTKDYMRFQYSKKMFERVYAAAPQEIKKKWERQQELLRRLKEEVE